MKLMRIPAIMLLCGSFAAIGAQAPEKHMVSVDHHSIAVWYKSAENPRKAILLLHGRTWSALPDFDLQSPGESLSLMDDLVKAGYAVYAMDQRGYGATSRDASGWMEPDKSAADISTILSWVHEHSKLDSVPALLGWSMGSTNAWLAAQSHPEKLSHLILYGCWWDPAQQMPVSESPVEPPRKATTRESAGEDFQVPGAISDQARDSFINAAITADPIRADWRNLHQYNQLDPARLTMPTLLIHGESDAYAKIEAQAAIFSKLGSSDREWVILGKADHAAHLENARARFLSCILSFLERP